jgi:hypothetical protein
MAAAISAIRHRSTAADWRTPHAIRPRAVDTLLEMLVGFNIRLGDDTTE